MFAQCLHDISLVQGLAFSLFLAGLVGGATHCAGMCGPFVLAQVDGMMEGRRETKSILRKLAGMALFPYHLGRMTTYVAMAVAFNALLNLAFLYQPIKVYVAVPMLMTAAVIFFVSAFPKMSSLFPWVGYIRLSVPGRWFSNTFGVLTRNPGIVKRYFLGVLLGFMPCGLVVSALMASATADMPIQAAFAMSMFALGTMLPLILLAWGGSTLLRRYPVAGEKIRQGAMVFSAVWLCVIAGQYIF